MTTETTEKKKIKRKKLTYVLAEVHRVPSMIDDETGEEGNPDAGEIESFMPLPMPKGVDGSGRDAIKRGLAKAIREGNTDYDGKELIILTYDEPFSVTVKTTRTVKIG